MSGPVDEIGGLLRETFRAMVRSVEHQFDDTDIALSQWLTLKLASAGQIRCIGDINRELGIESGTSTRLVDQLENKGLMIRERSDTDRRVVGLFLTPKGRDVVCAMRPRIVGFWERQLAVLDETERSQLVSMLGRLRDGLLVEAERMEELA